MLKQLLIKPFTYNFNCVIIKKKYNRQDGIMWRGAEMLGSDTDNILLAGPQPPVHQPDTSQLEAESH